MTRTRASLLAAAALGTLLVGGCASGNSSSPGQAAATSSESSPLGDIPDDQVYVPYSPADGSFSVTVPESWARTDLADGASFTDKLNTVTVEELAGRPQPTPDSVRAGELQDVAASGGTSPSARSRRAACRWGTSSTRPTPPTPRPTR